MKNLLLVLLVLPIIGFGQDGSLDNTFGTNGIVATPNDGDINASAIQTDGKIIAAGGRYNGEIFEYIFTLRRYNTNGSLDNTFGIGGIVTTIIGNQGSNILSIKIQADGKIVAAGYYGGGLQAVFALTRYNTNGSLDNTFGIGGIVTTSIGTSSSADAIDIQADGKIVAVGASRVGSSQYHFALSRYNTNGSLDNTFGIGGIVTTSIGTSSDAGAIDIQADGKIVVAGRGISGSQSFFALTRYNTNGSLDNTFGIGGIVSTFIGTSSSAGAIDIQADGKIVAAGQGKNGAQYHFALSRYNTNGSLDNSFGSGGIISTSIGTLSRIYDIAIQTDGKIVAAGYSDIGTQYNCVLTRYIINGSLDITFGINGLVTTSIGTSSSLASGIEIQTDGKIVAVGSASDAGGQILLARYNNSLTGDISENSNNTSQISIYPNPFSKATTLKTDNLFENATFIVYNSLGEQVRKIDNISGQTFTFYRENLEQGIYFYHLKKNSKILSADKLVITD
jgi:uncharacterized delta-60 repeat protein